MIESDSGVTRRGVLKSTAAASSVLGLVGPRTLSSLDVQGLMQITNQGTDSDADEPEERSLTAPTDWWWLTGASASQIDDRINRGFRLIDIEVERTSPHRFTAVFVENEGVYEKTWWWYFNISGQQLVDRLETNRARLIDLEVYYVDGSRRYSAVMVRNTGSNVMDWWFYTELSFDEVGEQLSQHGARLVDLDVYVDRTPRSDRVLRFYYSAVMIRNSGEDQKAWWYYRGQTAEQVGERLRRNQARLIDIESDVLPNRYAVIMERNPGKAWWWYLGVSEAQVNQLTRENGARLIDAEPFSIGGSKQFNVVMLQN